MNKKIFIASVCLTLMAFHTQSANALNIEKASVSHFTCPTDAVTLVSKRPKEADRLFKSDAVERER